MPSGRSEEDWGLGAVRRRFCEKGDEGWLCCASITGGGVKLSAARASGVTERLAEETISAARAAREDADLTCSEF